MVFSGFEDAQYAWAAFFSDKSAAAPFPEEWLPQESTCGLALESAKESATTFSRWPADLGSVVSSPSAGQGDASTSKPEPEGSVDELSGWSKSYLNLL